MTTPDFRLSGGGTIYMLRPITDAACAWVDEHIPEDASWLGGMVAIEHRYISPILDGIAAEGLTLASEGN